MSDYNNREDEPCDEDEHKFPSEYYELAADDSSALDCCCECCGWAVREIQDIAPLCSFVRIVPATCCSSARVQRCRLPNHHGGFHGASEVGPFFITENGAK